MFVQIWRAGECASDDPGYIMTSGFMNRTGALVRKSPSIQTACVNAGSFLDKTAYHADGIQKAYLTVDGNSIAIHMWRDSRSS